MKDVGLKQRHDELPSPGIQRRDRQAVATLEDAQRREFRMRAQFRKSEDTGFPDQGYVDVEPARVVSGRFGIEVLALAIELGFVRIRQLRNPCDSGDAGLRAARVVEEYAVPDKHLVAHEIARLIIANAPPRRSFSRCRGKIVDAEDAGLRFHQPVIHDFATQKKELRNSGTLSDCRTSAKKQSRSYPLITSEREPPAISVTPSS